jgi:hypothetical protein
MTYCNLPWKNRNYVAVTHDIPDVAVWQADGFGALQLRMNQRQQKTPSPPSMILTGPMPSISSLCIRPGSRMQLSSEFDQNIPPDEVSPSDGQSASYTRSLLLLRSNEISMSMSWGATLARAEAETLHLDFRTRVLTFGSSCESTRLRDISTSDVIINTVRCLHRVGLGCKYQFSITRPVLEHLKLCIWHTVA